MKKLILPIIVALMAAVVFTSCADDEMTDAEYINALAGSTFRATVGSGAQAEDFILTFMHNMEFHFTEPHATAGNAPWVSSGTWTVINGEAVLTFLVSEDRPIPSTETLAIQRSGDRLAYTSLDHGQIQLNRRN